MRYAAILLLASSALATDLSKVERKIAKAPAFQSATQFYALLVLGPEAKQRIWFVVDGLELFVDRNGNGDLTEKGEQIGAERGPRGAGSFTTTRAWKLPRLAASDRYRDIEVKVSLVNKSWKPKPDASNRLHMERFMKFIRAVEYPNLSGIQINIDGKRTQFCNTLFSTKPATAPILHMDGPLTLGIVQSLMPFAFGGHDDLAVAVGTPGFGGPGTFSYIYYDEIKEDARPFAIVTHADGKTSRHKLKEKC